jgi:Zn-dependent protease
MEPGELQFILMSLIITFLSIGVHEYGHAVVADAEGDPTPMIMGRVTLNPFKHFDPIGAIMIVLTSLTGYGIGWGKPVMVNPSKMRRPLAGHLLSVAAGPMMNLLIACVCAILIRVLLAFVPGVPLIVIAFLAMAVIINVFLMCFNLLPIGPLDGMWLLGGLMPETMRLRWYQFNRGIGSFLFLGLIIMSSLSGGVSLSGIIMPVARTIIQFLGVPPLF